MMDWTDRHCRYFHRALTHHALLYSEMVVDQALLYGDVRRHLDYSAVEKPLALQLGGSDPQALARAAVVALPYGYDEINLNVGCPSDRVQSGTFGAVLMKQPELVGACVAAIRKVVDIPVTVKCRIGVDEQDVEPALSELAANVFDNGCDGLWVHARKAWLEGLSPRENRAVPPLDYDRVYRLKQEWPGRFIGINGGIGSLREALRHLEVMDGVMLGRAAYHEPEILRHVDQAVYGAPDEPVTYAELCKTMMDYTASHLARGGRVNHVTRHMLGLFHGVPGARKYRQIMTVDSCKADATEEVIGRAFASVLDR